MKKISFISCFSLTNIFLMHFNAFSSESHDHVSQIVDQNIIKQYVQQFKPDQENINQSCKIASSQSKEFLQGINIQTAKVKITKEEEACLDRKYFVTKWGREYVVAYCDVKAKREFFSECFLNIKSGSEFIFYAQLILDSRDRKAHFFGDEIDINSFETTNKYVFERNNMKVSYNMKYSIKENGSLELHLYEGNSDKFLYTQTFKQMN
ncbi:hypothetical protein QEJ31_06770 [Pigmentibacter sp. JX0631]|uniref:hypothetical protein n=1 Tax=Pigmentibacter sp. JX0631 TaxID=2976982 RepID=UPI002469618F|nr:hypothetical protein [Pigmentibacter sp. JX0631]WGL61294.1 hypothetical protein QEJ31_06770 [Pigmentibacter sp. JX0631]